MRNLLLALSCLALTACDNRPEPAELGRLLAERQLLPSHQAWHQANQQLAASAQAFCSGQADLAQARDAWLHTQKQWSSLQPQAMGPLAEGNVAWQVQFWPDKKNLVARQVTQLLNAKPNLSQADLDGASVVVQGLTAVEYLLFEPSLDLTDAAQKARYCPLLTAIGTHQAQLSGRIVEAWQGEAGMLAQLSKLPSSRFADGQEAVAEILRTQVNALELLKKKLGTPLGRQSKGQPQPYQAEAWRSGASLKLIDASLDGAERLWRGDEHAGLRLLLGSDQAGLAGRIDAAWQDSRAQFAALKQPLAELLATPAGREQLNAAYDSLDRLYQLQANELAKALNIQLGFNAHDGD